MQVQIGNWPVYTLFLSFGQIISANSYQVTLLTGSVGQSAEKLYAIASVYLVTSILWWIFFRRFKAVVVLSTPFIFYGLAFFLLGLAPLVKKDNGQFWMRNIATGLYAIASASGSLFFALNFGDEGMLDYSFCRRAYICSQVLYDRSNRMPADRRKIQAGVTKESTDIV